MTFDTRPRYGEGTAHFLSIRAKERAHEEARFRREKAAAEKAIQDESESEGFLSFIFGTAGAVGGFFTGGLKGAAIRWTAGSEVGKWTHNIFLSDYESEDYHVTSDDVGKFDVMQKYDLEAFNAALDAQQSSEFWEDVTGTGKSLLTLYYLAQSGGSGNGVGPAGGDGSGMFFEDIPTFNPFETNPVSVT